MMDMDHWELVVMGAAINILLEAGKRAMPHRVLTHVLFVRTMPLTPLLLGVCGVSAMQGGVSASSVALGVCVGGLSGHLYKLAQQTLMGRDARLEEQQHGHDGAGEHD